MLHQQNDEVNIFHSVVQRVIFMAVSCFLVGLDLFASIYCAAVVRFLYSFCALSNEILFEKIDQEMSEL